MSLAISFAAALLTAFVAFRAVIPFALARELVDVPTSRRRHTRPMPIVGGVTLLAAWAAGVATFCLLQPSWLAEHSDSLVPICASMAILIALGLYDDLRGTGPKLKLVCQLAAALIVIRFEPTVHAFCLHWLGRVGPIIWPAATLWLVGLSNAINLVDGLDGLAAGISLCVACSLAVLSSTWGVQGELGLVLMAMLIPGLVAFLKHNWHPAEIFLGDNGSLPIGFLIATVSLMVPTQSRSWMQVINIVLMMGYPILDMGLCTYRRWKNKTPLFKADRNHLHHRILRLGLTVPQTCFLLLSLTFYLQLTALCVIHFIRTEDALITTGLLYVGAIFLSMFSLLYFLRALERQRTLKLAASPDNGRTIEEVPVFRECTVVKIELEPLYEAGLFEERERVHDVVASLKLMLHSMIRKDDTIYLSHKKLHIVLMDKRHDRETLDVLKHSIKERLAQFQTLYNLQYSLADLPVTFGREEFLVRHSFSRPKRKAAA